MDADTLRDDLKQFIGTEKWTRWHMLFPKDVLTDGALYLAEKAGAFWLMDLIASHQLTPAVRKEHFQVWELKRDPDTASGWLAVATDGNDNEIARQKIEYSDFPLDEGIKLYAVHEAGYLIILLPSER